MFLTLGNESVEQVGSDLPEDPFLLQLEIVPVAGRHETVPDPADHHVLFVVDVVADAPERSVELLLQHQAIPRPHPIQVVDVAGVLHQAVDLGTGNVEFTQDGGQGGAAGDARPADVHRVGIGRPGTGFRRRRSRTGRVVGVLPQVDPMSQSQHRQDQRNRQNDREVANELVLHRSHRIILIVAEPTLYHRNRVIRPKRADWTLPPPAPGW